MPDVRPATVMLEEPTAPCMFESESVLIIFLISFGDYYGILRRNSGQFYFHNTTSQSPLQYDTLSDKDKLHRITL